MSAPTIRSKLALLVLASATPAVLLTAGLVGHDYQRDRETLESDSIATARAMVNAIDRELVSLTTAGQILAASDRLQAGDTGAFYSQAQEIVARSIGANIVLSDASGQQLVNTFIPPGTPLPKHGNPGVLRKVFETGEPVVSDLYTGGYLRRPVMSIDVPVFRDGKVAYALSIGELPGRFLTILREQHLPEGWLGAVFDRSANIVARTHEHERFVGKPAVPALRDAMSRDREGAVETDTLEGIRVVIFFSRSEVSGWAVGLAIPADAVSTRLWERTGIVAVSAVLILCLGLALAWNIGGTIAASVRGLEGPAALVGSREQLDVPPLGLREVDDVGQALARASRLIVNAEHRAQHDPLTGLANRALFRVMAEQHIERCKRNGTRFALLFLDLDRFKQVNDTLGHEAGDKVLCAVAGRLRNAVRGSDVAARVGGDEFAVLLDGADEAGASAIAAKIGASLAEPYEAAGGIELSASIGIGVYPDDGPGAAEILKRADAAMYRAKTGHSQDPAHHPERSGAGA